MCVYHSLCPRVITLAMSIGSNHEHMAKEAERFNSFKQQCLAAKKKEPKGDGVLIFFRTTLTTVVC